ncbi:MAG: nitrilase-related carbon-nitrogen hydrolase [Desulfonatronovibrio sp.]
MKDLYVGVCQTPVLNRVKDIDPWLDKISAEDSKCLWVFPELLLGGFDYDHKDKWVEECLELRKVMNSFAGESGGFLAGTFWQKKDGKYFNTFYLFTPDQGELEIYSKIHLFLPGKENEHFSPGENAPEKFSWEGARIGFGICHDLRYPEIFLYQHKHEPDVFIVNAQWPLARIEHWLTLLKARAIENQCYVLACNGMGNSALGKLAGHSCLITSWGKTEFVLNEDQGMKKARLEQKVIKEDRKMFDSRRSPFFDLKFIPGES